MTNAEKANQIRMLGNCLDALKKQGEIASRVGSNASKGRPLEKEPSLDKRIQRYEDRIRTAKVPIRA